MRVADLQLLVQHNYWANERILNLATAITPEQFTASTRFPHGSLRGALVHMLSAERRYLAACQEREPAYPREEDFPSVARLAEQWQHDEVAFRAYLATTTADALDQPVTVIYRGSGGNGVSVTEPRWKFLM